MQINEIQQYLREHELDGWLMADFHGRNDIAMGMLGLGGMLTRRAFFFIPSSGEPTALVNPIEKAKFVGLPGKLVTYKGYRGLETDLAALLKGCKKVAMEYSENGRLPYVGLVEAGTIELVRSMEIEVMTSADMVANFQARLTPEQIAGHRIAARNLIEIQSAAFERIASALKEGTQITEYDVCQFILQKFEELDMETDHGPNCSVDAHAGDPHYEPTAENSAIIKNGNLILIDLWAKLKAGEACYADITWMAFAGTKDEIPEEYSKAFTHVIAARDTAVAYLREHLGTGPVFGNQVDDACRGVLIEAGMGDQFTSRTGHSIHTSVHGPGPNIDNLETEDNRKLQQGHLFSVEPGVYFDHFGMRSEIDCLIGHEGLEIATLPLQTEITALF